MECIYGWRYYNHNELLLVMWGSSVYHLALVRAFPYQMSSSENSHVLGVVGVFLLLLSALVRRTLPFM